MSPDDLTPESVTAEHRKHTHYIQRRIDFLNGKIARSRCGECVSFDVAERSALVWALESTERLAAVQAVHAAYFDMDGRPGLDDTDPEPEDVWRYDRDFRAALANRQATT